MNRILAIALIAGMALLRPAAAQAQNPGSPKSEAAKPLQKEIIKLKYIDAADVLALLQSYRSPEGSLGTALDSNKNNLIVISDHPKNVRKILALIKEIDVKPVELLFTVQLVLGSASGEEKTDETLKNDPVIQDIKELLKYKSFSLLDANLVRTMERQTAQVTLGKNGEYVLTLKPKYVKDEKEETIQTEIQFGYHFSGPPKTSLIQSTLVMKPGEKTVVGVSKLQPSQSPPNLDSGLILIISGKILKS